MIFNREEERKREEEERRFRRNRALWLGDLQQRNEVLQGKGKTKVLCWVCEEIKEKRVL